jgi:hypothetical protein
MLTGFVPQLTMCHNPYIRACTPSCSQSSGSPVGTHHSETPLFFTSNKSQYHHHDLHFP